MKGQSVPSLLLISDNAIHPDDVRIHAALAAGLPALLLRAPQLSTRDYTAAAVAWRQHVQHYRTASGHTPRLLVHDRVDIALAIGADGIHLPEHGLEVAVVQHLLTTRSDRARWLLGRSCHDVAGACRALAAGADYVTLSPLFATPSHPDTPPIGLETFTRWRREIPGPVLALGGVHAGNIPTAYHAGADGVALIGGILAQTDPAAATRACLAARASCVPACPPGAAPHPVPVPDG
jgi:thiamine-phosphate diphosphorylase